MDDTVQMKSAIQEFRKIGEKIQAMADKMMPTTKDEEKSVEKDEKDIKKERKDDKTERKIMKKVPLRCISAFMLLFLLFSF